MGRLAVAAVQPRQQPRGDRGDPPPDRRGTRRPVRTRQVPSGYHAHFISLIDPDDPDDPIRRQVIPLGREHQAFTAMMEDSLAEDRHSPVPGLVHRYPDRVLMLVTTQCASYCRYCTRSRIVGDPTQNFNRREHEAQLEYLRRTPQVRDVLISGGDGLTLAPSCSNRSSRAREIPTSRSCASGRGGRCSCQRIDDERARCSSDYTRCGSTPFQPPQRDHAGGSRRRHAGEAACRGQPVGAVGGCQRLVHIQRALVHKWSPTGSAPIPLPVHWSRVRHFRTPVGKGP